MKKTAAPRAAAPIDISPWSPTCLADVSSTSHPLGFNAAAYAEREIEQDHRRTAQALEGMDVLRAGAAGRLTLVPSVLDPEYDPLFAPARVWESVTDYHVTRHHRRLSDEEALKTDIASELERRGWPLLRPDAIEVIAAQRGPRGRLSAGCALLFFQRSAVRC